MKILKIEFENINSLKGFHKIDFSEEPFLTNSLFAITGPTGSGKSSILDVISLALFNHVPRLGKITRNEIQSKGAILTRNQKNSMARVTYQCNNGIFSSQWTIEINRNGNLNDYEMEIHDHHSGKLLDLKKSMVPSKNEELIGLNYDQFIKAVLLAQGEFAQFLKAKKDERGELLEKITGTGIYRKLGIRAFEKNREANRDIQRQQQEIQIIKEDLLSEELVKAKNEELQEKTGIAEVHQKEITKIQKVIDLKKKIGEHHAEIVSKKKQQESALEALNKFESEHGYPLKQHEKVQTEADNLREWNQLRKDLSNAKESRESISAATGKNQDQQKAVLQRTSELVKKPVSAEEILVILNDFRDKVLELQETRKNKLSSYSAKKDQLQSELRDTDIIFNEQDLDHSISLFNTELKASNNYIEVLNRKLNIAAETDITQLQQRTRSKIKVTREASKEFASIADLQTDITKIEKELKKDEPLLKELPGKIKKAKTGNEAINQQLQNAKLKKENQLLKASLEEHRRKLKDNEPCPLCGAEHHPYAHEQVVVDDKIDSEIAGLEAKFQASNKNLHELEADHKNLEKRQNELQNNLKTFQQHYQEKRTEFSSKFQEFEKIENKEALEKIADSLEEKLETLTDLEKQVKRSQAIQNAVPLAKEIREIISAGKTLKKELDAIYSGKSIQNDVQQISNNWSRLQQEQLTLKEQASENKKKIEACSEIFNQLEKTLNDFIANTDLDSIQNAWKVLMPEADASKLRNEKQQISKRIDESSSAIKLLDAQLKNMQKEDSEISLEDLDESLASRTESLNILKKEIEEIKRLLKNQQERLEKTAKLKEQILEKEKQTKRWRLLNELIGDSKGKGFNDFAQDLTLTQLLKLANVRLQDLNDRYLIDKPAIEEDDGLVAIDEHMGGQRRSVKTLSGGETFILSLSMALALSDLASKNVEINSLFIDEGFGTLDPETLDQTLDTLEKLQAESSKTIGIISHVDSLKERISTQIKLTRNGQGYSRLEIS